MLSLSCSIVFLSPLPNQKLTIFRKMK